MNIMSLLNISCSIKTHMVVTISLQVLAVESCFNFGSGYLGLVHYIDPSCFLLCVERIAFCHDLFPLHPSVDQYKIVY